jgi:flagellar hook-length control protein FliK
MRVNVLAPPSNSNAEPTANSRDYAENNPAGGFFAQIDQIWNQSRTADAAGEEKQIDQDEPKAEKEPFWMMTGVSLIPENPQPPVTESCLPGDLSSEEKRADCDEAKTENDPLTMMAGVSRIPENPQLPLLPPGLPDDHASKIQPAAPSLQTSEKTNVPVRISDKTSMAALFVKEAGNLLDASALNESEKPTIEATNTMEDSSIPIAEDSISARKTGANPLNPSTGLDRSQSPAFQRASDPSMPVAGGEPPKSNPGATPIAQAALEQSRSIAQRADVIAAVGKVELPDSLRMSVEPDKGGDAVPAAVQAKSGTIITRATLENAGTDNSHADRENSRHEGVSWTVQQSQLANAQKDSAKAASSIAERPADADSQMAASPVRLADAGAPAIPGAAEATTSRPKEFIFQLADRIQVQLRDGKGEIRIQLHPENLGHLEIKAEATVAGVVARIVAESSTVKNYLETNLHLLQQSLQDQGLKIDRIQVTVQDQGGSESSSGFTAQSGHTGSGNHGKSSGHSSEGSGHLSSSQPEETTAEPLTWIRKNPNARFYTVA